jgi:hypothetical protein
MTGGGSAPASRDEPSGVGDQPPEVPGYLVGQPLGRGSTSQVWSAVAVGDRRRVALKVLAPAGAAEHGLSTESTESTGPTESAELAVLRGLSHPHVVRRLDDLTLPDGRQVLVLELVGGGSLARVVRARGHLTAGETVTVVTALAGALDDLHRLGVTHADVAPGNVLLHLDGRPMLGDVGRSRIAGDRHLAVHGTGGFIDPAVLAGDDPGPGSDVYGLGAIGWFCLTGRAPSAGLSGAGGGRPDQLPPDVPAQLATAIALALAPAPDERPSAAELAHALYRSCPAEPVRLAGDRDPVEELTHRIRRIALTAAAPEQSGPRPRGAGARRWVRGTSLSSGGAGLLLAGLAVAAAVAGSVAGSAAGSAAAGSGRPPGPPAIARPAASPPLEPVVLQLTQERAAAFAQHPERGPSAFDRPGGPAWTDDAASLARLAAQGMRYRGLTLSVRRVLPIAATPERASVLVTFDSSAYDVVTVGGAVRAHRPAEAGRTVRLDLTHGPDGWRVQRLG